MPSAPPRSPPEAVGVRTDRLMAEWGTKARGALYDDGVEVYMERLIKGVG